MNDFQPYEIEKEKEKEKEKKKGFLQIKKGPRLAFTSTSAQKE
jgi:hypothetical protein